MLSKHVHPSILKIPLDWLPRPKSKAPDPCSFNQSIGPVGGLVANQLTRRVEGVRPNPTGRLDSSRSTTSVGEANMADYEYNNSNCAFLQAFIARNPLTFEEAKPILSSILSAHGKYMSGCGN